MSTVAVFCLGTASFTFGWMVCARIGRPAVEAKDRAIKDLTMERDRWERAARRQTLKRIMEAIAHTPHESKDDGARLLDDISDAWAHAERPGPRVGS